MNLQHGLLLTLMTFALSLQAYALDHSHEKWNSLLQSATKRRGYQTNFNYKQVKADPKALRSYLAELSSVEQSEFERWTSKQKLAFLINAYNAFTIQIIIENYPLESIKDIGNIFKSTWKKEFFTLLGKKRSLDDVEHIMIRKDYFKRYQQDARIHFAVNCASIGCPSLLEEAFIADKLDEQMNRAASNFLRNKEKNRLSKDGSILYLSPIFKWYGSDFKGARFQGKSYKNVFDYVADFIGSDEKMKKKIRNRKVKVKFTKYDWKLNEQKNLK